VVKLCAASVCRKRLGDSVLAALGLERGNCPWKPAATGVFFNRSLKSDD
jgi:hypothetical protein